MIIPLVLLVILVVLALLLRSLVAPLLLVATVVLSFVATLGACALVFRHVFGFPGADSSFPLFAFVFLVALGIDYNIFLMTRVREETLLAGTRTGTLRGLALTGGVITSAGVVLAATFGVLGVLPLVFLAELGFAVAFGVLLDTLVVRSLLVPALTLLLGDRVWWPSALASAAPLPPVRVTPGPEPTTTAGDTTTDPGALPVRRLVRVPLAALAAAALVVTPVLAGTSSAAPGKGRGRSRRPPVRRPPVRAPVAVRPPLPRPARPSVRERPSERPAARPSERPAEPVARLPAAPRPRSSSSAS